MEQDAAKILLVILACGVSFLAGIATSAIAIGRKAHEDYMPDEFR